VNLDPSATASGTTLHIGEAGTGDRLIARGTAPTGMSSMIACLLDGPLFNSLCVAGGAGYGDGVVLYSQTSFGTSQSATSPRSTRPRGASGCRCNREQHVTLTARSVIAKGPTDVNLSANLASGKATLNLISSNWTTCRATGRAARS